MERGINPSEMNSTVDLSVLLKKSNRKKSPKIHKNKSVFLSKLILTRLLARVRACQLVPSPLDRHIN